MNNIFPRLLAPAPGYSWRTTFGDPWPHARSNPDGYGYHALRHSGEIHTVGVAVQNEHTDICFYELYTSPSKNECGYRPRYRGDFIILDGRLNPAATAYAICEFLEISTAHLISKYGETYCRNIYKTRLVNADSEARNAGRDLDTIIERSPYRPYGRGQSSTSTYPDGLHTGRSWPEVQHSGQLAAIQDGQ